MGWVRGGCLIVSLVFALGISSVCRAAAPAAGPPAPAVTNAAAPNPAATDAAAKLAALRARDLAVGTKVAAPFAMKQSDGRWTGISIDLWRRLAERLGLRYHFVERPLKDLVDGVADGSLDVAVAAMTVTAGREARLDFSQPYFSTGLGIAVPEGAQASWWSLLRSLFSLGFLQAVFALGAVLLFVGLLLWAAERRRNDQFGGVTRGIGSGFWWSAVTMTTVGYGDKAPITLVGRLIAIGWMFASVILISSFTAGITTALTTTSLRGIVNDPKDLPTVRVGTVAGSEAADYLRHTHVGHSGFPDAASGLAALRHGSIDAFVYDRPLLQWAVQRDDRQSLRVLSAIFDKQSYAIALPTASPLREPLDRALLDIIQSDGWSVTLQDYLDERP